MKNQQMFKSATIMAAIVVVFALAAGLIISCPAPETSTPKKTGALLTSITIRGDDVEVPSPINKDLWEDDDFYDNEYTTTLDLNDISQLANMEVSVVISAGAKAEYGLASGYSKPEEFSSESTLTLTSGQAIYVRVTSEDGKTVNYYRFSITLKSTNSQLSTLVVAEMNAELGTPSNTYAGIDAITQVGVLSLSNAKKTNAPIQGTPRYNAAKVEYAFSTTSAKPAETEFTTEVTTHSFEDGHYIFIKVTAENNVDFSYYKIEVQVGRDATLASVKVGDATAENLGTVKTTWGNGRYTLAERGTCQADGRMPDDGFTVLITPTDAEATVQWAKIIPPKTNSTQNDTVDVTEPATWDGDKNESKYIFPSDASDLVIKVTSANTMNVNYYRVRFIAKSYGVIYKGTPKLVNPNNTNDKTYIDPIWNNAAYFTDEGEGAMKGWMDVSRMNTAESYAAWFATDEGRHTSARAKVLWDDDGLWVYWDITFKTPYTDNAGSKTRSASLSGAASTYTPGTDETSMTNSVPSDAHTRDSVEFFVNERWQTYKSGNYGNQYRSGLPASDGTIWLSGEKGIGVGSLGNATNILPPFNPITRFQINKKVRAWTKPSNGGYVIIMGVPWVNYGPETTESIGTANNEPIPNPNLGKDTDDQLFGADGKIIEGAEIGLELQVNACAVAGTRNGILTWNGVTSQAYQNVKSFGIVTLKTSK